MSAPDCQVEFDAETLQIAAPELPASSVPVDRSSGRVISPESFRSLLALSEGLAEFGAAALGVFAAYLFDFLLHPARQLRFAAHDSLAASAFAGLFAALLFHSENARRAIGSPLQIRETECAARVSILSVLTLLPVSYFFHLGVSTTIFFLALILTSLLLILERRLLVAVLRAMHAKGVGADRVVIYAAAEAGWRIASFLLHSPRLGLLPVAVVDDDLPHTADCISEFDFPRSAAFPTHRGPLTPARLRSCRCNLLLVAAAHSPENLAGIVRAAKQTGSRVVFVPMLSIASFQQAEWMSVRSALVASIADRPHSRLYAWTKRALDLLLSSILLVLLAPLLLAIALLIRLDSPGPALFIQKRVGLHGRLFDIYKFRSMHACVPPYDVSPVTSHDRRLTRVGRWLRRSSLDELPQLFNVLLGNMSLVGPRPEMPFLVARHRSQHMQRLHVTPGITGLWQLSSARSAPIHENPEFDLYYIRNRTYFLDIAILIHTLLLAVRGV
ncbi:MAG: exopolysaccharide biosynthesis polyprenyl glycosylphosphotransferase [Terracidiphilus sp.]|jgi:exopolysaccharide biosynthesis polyprenyl glycosylphosphotransferase